MRRWSQTKRTLAAPWIVVATIACTAIVSCASVVVLELIEAAVPPPALPSGERPCC